MEVVDDRFPVGSGSARQLGSDILSFIRRYTALGVAQGTRRVAIDSPPPGHSCRKTHTPTGPTWRVVLSFPRSSYESLC